MCRYGSLLLVLQLQVRPIRSARCSVYYYLTTCWYCSVLPNSRLALSRSYGAILARGFDSIAVLVSASSDLEHVIRNCAQFLKCPLRKDTMSSRNIRSTPIIDYAENDFCQWRVSAILSGRLDGWDRDYYFVVLLLSAFTLGFLEDSYSCLTVSADEPFISANMYSPVVVLYSTDCALAWNITNDFDVENFRYFSVPHSSGVCSGFFT